MRLIETNPVLFLLAGLCIFAVACFEVMTRQMGGPKVVEAVISEIWQAVRLRMSIKLLWLLPISAVLLLMLQMPGTH